MNDSTQEEAQPVVSEAQANALMAGLTTSKAGVALVDVATTGEESLPILMFDHDGDKGPLGIKKGQTITGRFRGTVPMSSTDFKENWKDEVIEGKTVYTNRYFEFETMDGKSRFGIYQNPFLNKVLPKLATKASISKVEKNPVVSMTYLGIIEGREVLAKEYDLQLTKGNSAHVVNVKLEAGVAYDPYFRGCANLLKSAQPNFGSKEKLSGLAQSDVDWARIQRANGLDIDGKPLTEISHIS
jgi:hypothetical protein